MEPLEAPIRLVYVKNMETLYTHYISILLATNYTHTHNTHTHTYIYTLYMYIHYFIMSIIITAMVINTVRISIHWEFTRK